jgi:hypothetical protein
MADSVPKRCKRSHAWRRARWGEHVEAQPLSGLCVTDYCLSHGLRRESFYRWRRVFAPETNTGGEGLPGLGEVGLSGSPVFVELSGLPLSEDARASGVELVLPGERRLRLEPGFDEDTLRRAVSVLESLPC